MLMAIMEEREANLPPFVFLYYLKSMFQGKHMEIRALQ